MSKGILEIIHKRINLRPDGASLRQLQRDLRIKEGVNIPVGSLEIYIEALARAGRCDISADLATPYTVYPNGKRF